MSYIDDMIALRRNMIYEQNNIELTPELVSEFKDAMLEMTMNVLYGGDDDTIVMMSEGGNIEMTVAFKDRMKEIVSHMNAAVKSNNKRNRETSRDELKKALKATNDLEKDIKDINFTLGSAFFGLFVGNFISKVQMFIPNFMVKMTLIDFYNKQSIKKLTPKDRKNIIDYWDDNLIEYMDRFEEIAYDKYDPKLQESFKKLKIANTFRSIVSLVKEIRGLYSIYKRYYKSGDSSLEAVNLYRNKMLMIVSDLKKVFSAMIKNVEKRIEMEKKSVE